MSLYLLGKKLPDPQFRCWPFSTDPKTELALRASSSARVRREVALRSFAHAIPAPIMAAINGAATERITFSLSDKVYTMEASLHGAAHQTGHLKLRTPRTRVASRRSGHLAPPQSPKCPRPNGYDPVEWGCSSCRRAVAFSVRGDGLRPNPREPLRSDTAIPDVLMALAAATRHPRFCFEASCIGRRGASIRAFALSSLYLLPCSTRTRGLPRIDRGDVYLGACMIAGIRLARERQVNVRVIPIRSGYRRKY